jgi:hypothetical protein
MLFCGLNIDNYSEESAYFDLYSSFLMGKYPKINPNHKPLLLEFGFGSDYKE